MNLCIEDIFKESNTITIIVEQTVSISIVSFFNRSKI